MKKRTFRIITIIFLVFVVIGFTAPIIDLAFFDDTPSSDQLPPQLLEPKLCTTDSDCSLECNPLSDPIICVQNVCAQTQCDQTPLNSYYYTPSPTVFELKVVADNLTIPLFSDPQNVFVSFASEQARSYSATLPLIFILEKAGLTFNENCLIYGRDQYCQDETHHLTLTVNGNDSDLRYIPQENDKIVINYQKITPAPLNQSAPPIPPDNTTPDITSRDTTTPQVISSDISPTIS